MKMRILEMAQEWILTKGDRSFDSCCPRTGFNNKLNQVKTSETPLCRLCGDAPETV